MAFRRSEFRPVVILVLVVVPEPILARLERPDDGMSGLTPMCRCVPGQRIVAAADVPARRAAAQMDPPAAARIALDATRAARRNRWVDGCTHAREPTGGRSSHDQDFKSARFNQDEQNQMRWGNQPI